MNRLSEKAAKKRLAVGRLAKTPAFSSATSPMNLLKAGSFSAKTEL